MFDSRSRAGIAGLVTGAALLALPVVASGQVPVVDQVVDGVTQTAESLAPAPLPPVALPAPGAQPAPPSVPAVPTPAAPGSAEPGAQPDPAPAPRGVPGALSAPVGGHAARSSRERASGAKSRGGRRGGASAGAASGQRASAAQADSVAEPNASASGADQGGGPTDVEIAAADSGDADGPASLPFTGLQLALMGLAGLATLAGGALLRRAA